MGHSSIKVTFDVYLIADDDADQRAAEGVQAKLPGTLTKNEPGCCARVERTERHSTGKGEAERVFLDTDRNTKIAPTKSLLR